MDVHICEQADKLVQFYTGINSSRVTLAKLHKHHSRSKHFQVRVDIQTRGHELVAGRETDQSQAYTDVYVAVRDVFKAMRRQLEDLVRHQKGHVKHHGQRPHDHITEISPDRRFGRIESADGRWLFFHRNSLIGEGMDKLQVGTPVCFVKDISDESPHASSFYPVGRHHILV